MSQRPFTVIDMSLLPAPEVVEALDFEAVFQAMLADLRERDPAFDALVESDPAYKILEVAAYRELLLRQRVNDAARAVMLAYASGAALDHLAAIYGIARWEGEGDAAFRARVQESFEAFTTAGPQRAYVWHAMAAVREWTDEDGRRWRQRARDVTVSSPLPGSVDLHVLAGPEECLDDATLTRPVSGEAWGVVVDHEAGYADGATEIAVQPLLAPIPAGAEIWWSGGRIFTTDSDAMVGDTALTGILEGDLADGDAAGLLPAVDAAVNDQDVRPLCDAVTVLPAAVLTYAIEASLTIYYGPDEATVLAAALAGAEAWAEQNFRLGRDLKVSALHAALHAAGVQGVELSAPGLTADLVVSENQAARCTGFALTVAGRDN